MSMYTKEVSDVLFNALDKGPSKFGGGGWGFLSFKADKKDLATRTFFTVDISYQYNPPGIHVLQSTSENSDKCMSKVRWHSAQ